MPATMGEVLIWIIIGALCGSVVGMLVKRDKQGFGHLRNLLLGMAGSVVGGVLLNLTGIDLGLGELSISFEDLASGFAGSILILIVAWLIRRYRSPISD